MYSHSAPEFPGRFLSTSSAHVGSLHARLEYGRREITLVNAALLSVPSRLRQKAYSWKSKMTRNRHATEDVTQGPDWLLSEGEIHHLWDYIQGSIMYGSIRERLINAWGFCQRHAWGAILVESAFRDSYLHGPTILYANIMRLAVSALDLKGPFKNQRILLALSEKAPCMMCEMGLGPGSKGAINPDRVSRGRDATQLRVFARGSQTYWEGSLCGQCMENELPQRCRLHLTEEMSLGKLDGFEQNRKLVNYIMDQIMRYSLSFRWENRGTVTEENKAALVSAVGWCSGWQTFMSILGIKK